MKVTGRVWTNEPETYKGKDDKEHFSLVLVDEDESGQSEAQFFRVEVSDPKKFKRGQLVTFWGTVSFANQGNVRFRAKEIIILDPKK